MLVEAEYRQEEAPERFRDTAFAYLDASIYLCSEIEKGNVAQSFEMGLPVLSLAFHGTELILKAAIAQLAPSRFQRTHSLADLASIVQEVAPEIKFSIPFGVRPASTDEQLATLAERMGKGLHLSFRYPPESDTDFKPGVRSFSPDLFHSELRRLRKDFTLVSDTVFGRKE